MIVASFVFAIAGAAMCRWNDDYYSLKNIDIEQLEEHEAARDNLKNVMKTAQVIYNLD